MAPENITISDPQEFQMRKEWSAFFRFIFFVEDFGKVKDADEIFLALDETYAGWITHVPSGIFDQLICPHGVSPQPVRSNLFSMINFFSDLNFKRKRPGVTQWLLDHEVACRPVETSSIIVRRVHEESLRVEDVIFSLFVRVRENYPTFLSDLKMCKLPLSDGRVVSFLQDPDGKNFSDMFGNYDFDEEDGSFVPSTFLDRTVSVSSEGEEIVSTKLLVLEDFCFAGWMSLARAVKTDPAVYAMCIRYGYLDQNGKWSRYVFRWKSRFPEVFTTFGEPPVGDAAKRRKLGIIDSGSAHPSIYDEDLYGLLQMVRNIINHIGEEGRNADACRAYLDTYMDEKTSKPQILPDLSSRFQYWWSREMNNVVEVVSERVTPVEFSDTFNDLVREIRTFRRQETTKDESVCGWKGYGRLHWALLDDADPQLVRSLVLKDHSDALISWRDCRGYTAVDWAHYLIKDPDLIWHDRPDKIADVLTACEVLLRAVQERGAMQ